MGRNLNKDRQIVRQRAETITRGLGPNSTMEFPLDDCTGIAVPVLLKDRNRFFDKSRQQGVFLPAHWPRDESIPASAVTNRWYEGEVSIPTLAASPAADIDFMIDRLCPIQ
jgi:hypothetical protein